MTDNALPDVWSVRDLPVLREFARRIESDDDDVDKSVKAVAGATGLEERAVSRARAALIEGGYLREQQMEVRSMDGKRTFYPWGSWLVLTERGRRTVGLWPDGDAAVEQLLSALRQAEDLTEDPDDKTALRKAGGQLASVSRSVVAEVIAAVVTRQAGL
jgi:hypothetical protein